MNQDEQEKSVRRWGCALTGLPWIGFVVFLLTGDLDRDWYVGLFLLSMGFIAIIIAIIVLYPVDAPIKVEQRKPLQLIDGRAEVKRIRDVYKANFDRLPKPGAIRLDFDSKD